ncbi:DUF4383 domain-containing protein [Saccharophagus degradans]|uniref:Uncharacterized protein n=1 Tax=Saccharophagus degradans (strain 2-40 / ATCC 43961 / DSM 17024) TaxID=203122 RepID=Q21H04_SACD2|nr:DUF4383 domain-containing protein [Saccharophagus degradans]ABD82025.1 conserved hypothetical protein [Saccharophagus degradans 2-40]
MTALILHSKNIALAFGFTFIAVALLGFVPNPLVSPHGVFAVNLAHNLVHLLTGVAFVAGVYLFRGREHKVILVLGGLYFAVAILGFFTKGDMLLGIVHINEADRWLHLGLALAILVSGMVFKSSK